MPTLLEMVEAIGADILQVVVADHLDVSISRLVIHDVSESAAYHRGDLVLGVGLIEADAACDVVGRGPAALVVRGDLATSEALMTAALQQGVALLGAPPAAEWGPLHQALAQVPTDAVFRDTEALTSTQLVQDLFELANGIAAALDAPVTIEDNQSRLLAYSALQRGADEARSATILGHRVPDAYRREVRRLGVARRLLEETEPFVVTTKLDGVMPRVVVALRGQGQVLGSMWVIPERSLSTEQQVLLSDAARAVSARLLHQRLVQELRLRLEANTLALVLAGGPAATEAARRIRLVGQSFRLLVVAPREVGLHGTELLHRCAAGLRAQLAMAAVPAWCAALGPVAVAILADAEESDARGVAKRAVEGLTKTLEPGLSDALIAAFSARVGTVEHLPGAHAETLVILQAMRLRARGVGFADKHDVASEMSLIQLAELRATHRSDPPSALGVMAEHDEAQGTNYLETLSTYLAAFGDPAATADTLAIHINTLRYRLRRIREMFDLDLDDHEVRFTLLLEFRVARIAEALRLQQLASAATAQ